MPHLATIPHATSSSTQRRDAHPVFRIGDADADRQRRNATAHIPVHLRRSDVPATVEITGLRPHEAAAPASPPRSASSALCPSWKPSATGRRIAAPSSTSRPHPGPGETVWWPSFWPQAMGEFFNRNGIDYTTLGFLRITAERGPLKPPAALHPPPRAAARPWSCSAAARTHSPSPTPSATAQHDFFLYNPTQGQRTLAESLRRRRPDHRGTPPDAPRTTGP